MLDSSALLFLPRGEAFANRPWEGPRRAELIRAFLAGEDDGGALIALTFFAPADAQWSVIVELIDAAPDDETVLAHIAAGPVEGLLARFGDTVIPWVEARAATDHRFRRVLRGVWQHTMSDAIWARVCAARDG